MMQESVLQSLQRYGRPHSGSLANQLPKIQKQWKDTIARPYAIESVVQLPN